MQSKTEILYQKFLKHRVISTDSRNIPAGSIFFALKGENFNGNDYAVDALDKGAALAVIDEEKFEYDQRFFIVNDVLSSLQELAKYHRKNLAARVIGITGTNGKTTTKELIQFVLSRKYKSRATQGNLNNHIGVPLTILSLTKKLDFAVIEMGANHIGEISTLCDIAQPDFGIITNIGKAHLEGFGGTQGVKKAKTELYDYIRQNGGKIFINTENKILTEIGLNHEKVTYGTHEDNFCRGKLLDSLPFLSLEYRVKEKSSTIHSKIFGNYNFENILAAICIGSYFDVELKDIDEAINLYEPENNRSQLISTDKNEIILDAYNANPSSMMAAIQNFTRIKAKNKTLILGDMLELGDVSLTEHLKILDNIDNDEFRNIFLVGDIFLKAGKTKKYNCFKSINELIDYMKMSPIKSNMVLLKGSRKIQLEMLKDVL